MSGSGDLPLPVMPDPMGLSLSTQLLLFTTPDDWVAKINEAQDEIYKNVKDGIDKAFDKINGLSVWELIGLGVINPGLGVTAALGQGILGDKLQGMAHKIWDKIDDLWDAIQHAVDALIGNPAHLIELSNKYLSVKTTLNGAANNATHEGGQLGKYWSGLGFDSFKLASEEQVAAINAIAAKFESAANLVASSAEGIKLAWSSIVQALLALAADIIDKIADGLDLGNILTGDSGPIIGLIGTGLTFVNDVTKAIRDLDASADTAGKMEWMTLSSGSEAFNDGDKWPAIDSSDSGQYSDSGLWKN